MDCRYSLIFIICLSGCDNAGKTVSRTPQQNAALQHYIKKVRSDLIYVKGGSFWMGDFCKKMRNGGADCTGDKDNKPLHKVELTSYSIAKFKTTNAEYNYYLSYTHQHRTIDTNKMRQKAMTLLAKYPSHPANVGWGEAKNYCRWLSTVTGLPFALPTEAQWEYAARSRGEYRIVATDDNTLRVDKNGRGENIATDDDRQDAEEREGIDSLFVTFPGDRYPPNPLGIYDMSGNGFEWTNDWYDPNYYAISQLKDPQGPDKPMVKDTDSGSYMKVLRGKDYSNIGVGGTTIERHQRENTNDFPMGSTVRCVVNSVKTIN